MLLVFLNQSILAAFHLLFRQIKQSHHLRPPSPPPSPSPRWNTGATWRFLSSWGLLPGIPTPQVWTGNHQSQEFDPFRSFLNATILISEPSPLSDTIFRIECTQINGTAGRKIWQQVSARVRPGGVITTCSGDRCGQCGGRVVIPHWGRAGCYKARDSHRLLQDGSLGSELPSRSASALIRWTKPNWLGKHRLRQGEYDLGFSHKLTSRETAFGHNSFIYVVAFLVLIWMPTCTFFCTHLSCSSSGHHVLWKVPARPAHLASRLPRS